LDLTADFDLSNGGTLSLIVLADGTLKELSRTSVPVATVTSTAVSYTTATLDSEDGSVFNYTGAADLTITDILNGVQGQKITISGKAGADSTVTINTIGSIKTTTSAALALATDTIELVLLDGVWTEFNRTIA
jgi:hypothetical protein